MRKNVSILFRASIQRSNIIYDVFTEELSFPAIYYGTSRQFNVDMHVTPLIILTSEMLMSRKTAHCPTLCTASLICLKSKLPQQR